MSAMRGEEIGEVAFGFGDVMLGMLSGLLLGWQAFLFGFMITLFLGAAGAVLYLLSRLVTRTGYAMFTALPYGPYIVLGTVIMMLWREEVRAFLLR
jgi:prepilin signal peptidase PulO-like enzyme (type II secretory pathway)